ncbi:MAG: winged helix-turn-helix domain-containing protein [Desulfovibrio sp.]|jgi:transposase|nr:winged helix-turn-helix domain-containing protein [Desulfovibrio sp.]
MARPASGREILATAKEALREARTLGELRKAQAVILPLEFGFSLEQVASVLGVSRGWACQLRTQFIRAGGLHSDEDPKRGGRRRENMSKEEERAFLAPFIDKASKGGILVVGEIKRALDTHLGREVALASVYNLLHHHNWRKLAPDKRHPQLDPVVQEEWKKNFRGL